MKFEKPLFLVGMPGCGKTLVGEQLAKNLNIEFIDLDTVIEEQSGASVSQIIGANGEEKFRQLEKDSLVDLVSTVKGVVIATGGGTPCFHENMKLINAVGISIYLKTSLDFLKRNIEMNKSERPILNESEDLSAQLEAMMEKRDWYYEQASIHVITNNLRAGDIATIIVRQLNQ